MGVAAAPMVELRPPRRRRIGKIVLWLGGLALFWLILQLLGIDVRGWLAQLWDQTEAIPPGYIVAALIFQAGIVLVCVMFGWRGGREMVTQPYADAKSKTTETKEEHRRKRLAKKEAKRQARAPKEARRRA